MTRPEPTRHTIAPLFTWRSAIVDSELPPTARHVALTLSLHMNERGGSCFPSLATITAETGLSRSTVKTHMAELGAAGWIEKEPQKRGNGSTTSNRYTATIPSKQRGSAPGPPGGQLPAPPRSAPGPHGGQLPAPRSTSTGEISKSTVSLKSDAAEPLTAEAKARIVEDPTPPPDPALARLVETYPGPVTGPALVAWSMLTAGPGAVDPELVIAAAGRYAADYSARKIHPVGDIVPAARFLGRSGDWRDYLAPPA